MSDMLYPRKCMVGFYYTNPCYIRDKKKISTIQKKKQERICYWTWDKKKYPLIPNNWR